MTDKLIMTTTERDLAIEALQIQWNAAPADAEPKINEARNMLQSLPMVDSEPVTHLRYVERGHAPDDYWTDLEICDVDTKDAFQVYTSPQALTPDDDGSDWFYKLQFICRVLQGESPDKTDMQTALGMAQSLKRERWTAETALTPITVDDVTDEMLDTYIADISQHKLMDVKIDVAAAFNAVIKHKAARWN